MFILTNKELRHLKAVYNQAFKGSTAPECSCDGCKAMRKGKKYFDALKPNS
jgi:hypothetical protein